jgi:hypothetical protein
MSAVERPYFIWDYDLTEEDVRKILRGPDEDQRAWVVARLLEAARYEDIWKYISLGQLREIFPKLKLKSQVRAAWEFAMSVWIQESVDGR